MDSLQELAGAIGEDVGRKLTGEYMTHYPIDKARELVAFGNAEEQGPDGDGWIWRLCPIAPGDAGEEPTMAAIELLDVDGALLGTL